jgi:HEAT repeat protein
MVADITNGTRAMPVLVRMLRHASGRILSKLLLLIGKLRKEPSLFAPYTANPDPRIHANALEAMWGNTDEVSMGLFFSGSRDNHHRVAINGLIGLHMAGRPTAIVELERLTQHECPLWRAAAAWALGQVGDESRGGAAIRKLMSDPDPRVRGAALRATIQLKKRESAQPAPPAKPEPPPAVELANLEAALSPAESSGN